jgi:hypothetical protein
MRWGLLGVAGAVLLVGLWREPGDGSPSSNRYALSPQECVTECQSRQTDCILDCDGQVPCERRCTDTGMACVERCRRPDAGAGGAGGGPGIRRGRAR